MNALRWTAVLAAALALGAATGGASTGTLRVGYGYGFDVKHEPDNFGFDVLQKQDGLKVKLEQMGSPTDAIVALDRGDLDLANLGLSQIVPAIAAGAKLRVIMSSNTFQEFALVARAGITRASQLRGKTVLISSPQGSTATFVEQLLKRGGLSPGDVHFGAVLNSSDRVIAFEHGRADAVLLEQLDIERLTLAHRGFVVLGRMPSYEPPEPSSVWAVSPSFLSKHPDEVQQIADSLVAGYREAYTPAGAARFVHDANADLLKGDDPRLASLIYAWYKAHHYWPSTGPVYSKQAYDQLAAFWKAHGVIEGSVPPYSQVWDARFWRRAVSR